MAGSSGSPLRGLPEPSCGDLVHSEPPPHASLASSTQGPSPRFTARVLPHPCSAKTCLCSVAHSQLFQNKEEAQSQMSSCKVMKLAAWSRRSSGLASSGGLESAGGLSRGTCWFSRPSVPYWRWCSHTWLST